MILKGHRCPGTKAYRGKGQGLDQVTWTRWGGGGGLGGGRRRVLRAPLQLRVLHRLRVACKKIFNDFANFVT